MRIGELSARAGMSVKALRVYEAPGPLPRTGAAPIGYRDRDEAALSRLRSIEAARSAGPALAEIRQVIAVREASGPPCRHVAALLDAHGAEPDRQLGVRTA